MDTKKPLSEERIRGVFRATEAGVSVKELCRRHGFSEASYYVCRSKFGGLEVSEAKRLKAPEQENARLKKLLAESLLEQEVHREALRNKVVGAPARCEVVRWMKGRACRNAVP